MEGRSFQGAGFARGASRIRVYLLPRSGFALALLANLIWGTSFLASKVTLLVWGPFTASALRFAAAIAGMLLVLPALGLPIQVPRSRGAWWRVLLVGVSGFGLLYPLQLAGLNAIPSSLSAAIMLTSPLFVLMFTAGFLRETLSQQKLFAIGLGIVGGVILVSPSTFAGSSWSLTTLPRLMGGFVLTLGASLSLALSVVATRSAARDLDSRSLTFWSMCVGEALLIPLAFFEKQPLVTGASTSQAVLALIFLALFCSVFAFLIWNRALTISSPQEIASTMHVKTPVAVLLGIAVAGEPMTFSIIAGSIMISFAVWLSQYQARTRPLSQTEGTREGATT
jgi:drug/metabolite transporter (DMT)-like permease